MKKKVFLICLILFGIHLSLEFLRVLQFKEGPTSIGDGYSEVNAVKGAQAFRMKGIFSDYGLPDHCYAESGGKNTCVYTHYPPGPEYIVYLSSFLVGNFNWFHLRMIPLVLNFLLLIIALLLFLGQFRPIQVLLFFILLGLHPFFWRFWHNMHYQGYAFYLLLVSFGVVLYSDKKFKAALVSLFAISFLQGFLSFDYFFLTTLAPVTFYSFIKGFEKRTAAKLLLVCGGGFAFAHALHFLQVIFHFGSFEAAFTDFRDAAKNRANNEVIVIDWVTTKALNPFKLFSMYMERYTRKGFLPISLLKYFLLTIVTILVIRFYKIRKLSTELFPTRVAKYLILALLVSSLWVLVMRQHSFIHYSFINQHFAFFVIFILWGLVIQSSFAFDQKKHLKQAK